MKTLLSVNNYYYRRDGSEVVYFEHNRALADKGWKVVPFAMQHAENLPAETSDFFVEELEFGQHYSVIDRLKRVPKFVYSLEARRKLAQVIEASQPDIAHCHTIYHHLSPSILSLLKSRGIPTVMTIHDLKLGCPAYHMHTGNRICEDCHGGRLRNVVRNRCIKDSLLYSSLVYAEAHTHQLLGSYRNNVDRFIAPCQFYIDKLVEWGWDRRKFVHIPNSLAPEQFQPVFGGGDGHVLYFGRLSSEKGLLTLIAAAALAKVPVVFAGDGPQRAELEEAARTTGAIAHFIGRLTPAELSQEVHRASATVLPSEWYENAPMSVLESFAWGTPVIGARIGGIPEMIEHDVNGALFDPGSVEGLAEQLARFSSAKSAKLAAFGRAARTTLEEKFSTELYVERIEALYTSLTPEPATASLVDGRSA